MRYFRRSLIAICLLATSSQALLAGSGARSLQFMEISVGARQSAMGDASTVTADSNAVFYNPALINKLVLSSLSVSHNSWLAGITQQTAAGTFRTSHGTFGIGIIYLHMDEMDGYDIDGLGAPVKISDFTASDIMASISYARELDGYNCGLSLKFVQESIEDESASGFCFDIGVQRNIDDFSFGISANNIGPKIKFIEKEESIPLALSAGSNWQPQNLPVLVAADLKMPSGNDIEFGLGSEYTVKEMLSIRAGYRMANDNRDGFSAGLGIMVSDFTLDYAYTPFGELGNVHKISISIKLTQ